MNSPGNNWKPQIIVRNLYFDLLFLLTHCGLVTPYGIRYLGNAGSGKGLLPDGIKPLPEPMLTYHQ